MKKRLSVVLASGVFDILHLGHIYYLEQSKKMGDLLYVVIASDKTVIEKKGQPFNEQEVRKKIIQALRCVDKVIIGAEDFAHCQFDIIKKIRPDTITIGYDQKFDPLKLEQQINKIIGQKVKVRRISEFKGKFNKTSKNIQKIYQYHKNKK